MGPLGMGEIVFLFLVALLLFGPGKLPELGRMLGRGLAEFRRASHDLRATIEEEIQGFEKSIAPAAKPASTAQASEPAGPPSPARPTPPEAPESAAKPN